MYTNIGEFICQKRMENNLTLRELASMLSISLTYLADSEHYDRVEAQIWICQSKDPNQDHITNGSCNNRQVHIAP